MRFIEKETKDAHAEFSRRPAGPTTDSPLFVSYASTQLSCNKHIARHRSLYQTRKLSARRSLQGAWRHQPHFPAQPARARIWCHRCFHRQSVAYAAQLFGVKARIVVPEAANPGKVAAMQGMGAEVIFHGARYDEARLYCEALAHERGYRYI